MIICYVVLVIKFNKDISNQDVSNITNMNNMFRTSEFNGDISNWDISNVTDMSYMFYNCDILKEYKPNKKTFKE